MSYLSLDSLIKEITQQILPYRNGIRYVCPIDGKQTSISSQENQSTEVLNKIPQQYLTKSSGILSEACSHETFSQCN